MLRYLSLDWLDALGAEVAASDRVREAAAGRSIAVTQVVTGGPEGDVMYHLNVEDGDASFGPGPAPGEQVRMVQDWETAVDVATGAVNAQEAFVRGRIRVMGDAQRLIEAGPLFAALDSVFATVRERTEYA